MDLIRFACSRDLIIAEVGAPHFVIAVATRLQCVHA